MGASEPTGSFAPCAYANGESDEAPECSAAMRLDGCLEEFNRQAISGVCDTGRYRMPYKVWGRGPALILVPGMCDDAESFVLPLARLSRSFCCIVYDLPNGHDDGARLANITHADLVADLFALTEHLHITSAALLGVSFGSTIALAALARNDARFPVGMVQGGFAKRPLAPAEVALAQFARYWPGQLAQLPLWLASLERIHSRDFAELEPGRWSYFRRHHGDARIAAVAHRALMIHRTNLLAALPAIRQPVLLICGEHDPVVSRTCEESLRNGLPNVARAEIEGCGHVPQFTHPEVLCEVIEQFLGKSGFAPSPLK